MATTIAEHTGTTKMGCFIISVHVTADVSLVEDDSGKFQFFIKYGYSGSKSGSGHTTVNVSGNTSGDYKPESDVVIHYDVTNWNLTNTTISLNLSASIEYTGTPSMGPDSIFNNQQFSGPRRAVKLQAEQDRFAKYVALHDAIHKATGASVEHVYK